MDYFEECDDKANITKLPADPLLQRIETPSDDQRVESGKIIRMLMVGMRTLWHPVIRAIASHADMKSLGQGKGKGVAAAVGRQRVIEGLRLAESIRKGLGRQERVFFMWQSQVRARQTAVHRPGFSVDDIIKGTLVALAGNAYLNHTAGPVDVKPLAANDNHRFDACALRAA